MVVHEMIPTLLPHNSKTIGLSSMKFGMQLHPPPQNMNFLGKTLSFDLDDFSLCHACPLPGTPTIF